MSKKRTSDESNNDEQTLFKNQENVKRANVDSNSDTTLQDLPMELLECILVKVVATEVIDLKLVKSVWKEKAAQVIGRLGTVSSQWISIMSTNFFQNKVHRILDDTAEESLQLEVLHEFPIIHSDIRAVTAMNDEIFMLYRPRDKNYAIHVYDRNNMAVVMDVIPLQGVDPVCMEACNVSNCVYVGIRKKMSNRLSVLRISKDAEQQFRMLPWIRDHKHWIATMSVSANGCLIIISLLDEWDHELISVYDSNGSLQQEVTFSPIADALRYKNVLQRANGNFIVVYINQKNARMQLTEIDRSGRVVRQYDSVSFLWEDDKENFVSFADIRGGIVIGEPFGEIEILDSEFNLKDIYILLQDEDKHAVVYAWHYDSKRNEILRVSRYRSADGLSGVVGLTIFRFP